MLALAPMAIIYLSWLLLYLMFSGLGLLVLRVLRRPVNSSSAWFDSFWLGWAISLMVMQLWHLAFPVDDSILVIFVVIATASLYTQRHALLSLTRKVLANRAFLLLFLLLMLWMSNRAIEMPDASDTGFRDIQAVMWMSNYPIVPGLNNLFASLAYNHSVYLYDALLDVSVWSGRAQHIATGLIVMAYLIHPVRALLHLHRAREAHSIRWSWIFAALTIPYILFYTVGRGGITHFLTDTPVDLIGFLVITYLLDFLQDFKPDSAVDDYLVYRIAILVLIGFTVKQSFAVFGICIAVFILIILLVRGGSRAGQLLTRRVFAPIATLAVIAIVPWMIRGVVTSGYVAYPMSIGRVEVEWAEPVELLQHRQERLATNTRQRYAEPGQVLSSWQWIGPWFNRIRDDVATFALPVSITLAALAMYFVGRITQSDTAERERIGLWIYLPLIVMLVFWFFTFPNYKYVRYIIWSGAGLAVLLAILAWHEIRWRTRVRGIYLVLGLCLLWGIHLVVSQGNYPLPAGPNDGLYDHFLPPIKTFETDSGLRLNVPNSHIPQCWQIPLPCTPYPRAGIYELVPGEFWRGFGYRAADAKAGDDA